MNSNVVQMTPKVFRETAKLEPELALPIRKSVSQAFRQIQRRPVASVSRASVVEDNRPVGLRGENRRTA